MEDVLRNIKPDRHSRAALFGMGGVGYVRISSLVERHRFPLSSPLPIEISTLMPPSSGYSQEPRTGFWSLSDRSRPTWNYLDTATQVQTSAALF